MHEKQETKTEPGQPTKPKSEGHFMEMGFQSRQIYLPNLIA